MPDLCPACGDLPDYCQGHGEIGDPWGSMIVTLHERGNHTQCHSLSDCR